MKNQKIAFLIISILWSGLSSAGEIKTYSDSEFNMLTKAAKPVVLEVFAPWCPTCRAQKPIVEALIKQSAYKNVTVLTIDFDNEAPTLKKFKVTSQSTLISFKGEKEIGRSVGDTDPASLERFIKAAIQ